MKINLKLDSNWDLYNKKLKTKFKNIHPQAQVLGFKGVGHALIDLFYGMKEFWPIRKHIIVFKEGDPFLMSSTRIFSRENYNIDYLSFNAGDWKEQLQNKIKSDTLAVIYCSDHAFTGQIYVENEIAQLCLQKKIPAIEVTHSFQKLKALTSEQYSLASYNPFHIYLWELEPESSLVFAGHRVKFFNHSADLMDWTYAKGNEKLNSIVIGQEFAESQKLILDFEEKILDPKYNLNSIVTPYFNKSNNMRLWDRSVLKINQIGGDYFIHTLGKEFGISLSVPGFEQNLETAHFCRWNQFEKYEWWVDGENLNPDDYKGLVAISNSLIAQPDFFEHFARITHLIKAK